MGNFPFDEQGVLMLTQLWGLLPLAYNGGFTLMTLHDLFTLQILFGINIRVQYIKYTSEYIVKLQIHQ